MSRCECNFGDTTVDGKDLESWRKSIEMLALAYVQAKPTPEYIMPNPAPKHKFEIFSLNFSHEIEEYSIIEAISLFSRMYPFEKIVGAIESEHKSVVK